LISYANDYPEKLKGVELASYPNDTKIFTGNLKGLGLKVSSIWGTKDGLTTEDEKIEGSKLYFLTAQSLLPLLVVTTLIIIILKLSKIRTMQQI